MNLLKKKKSKFINIEIERKVQPTWKPKKMYIRHYIYQYNLIFLKKKDIVGHHTENVSKSNPLIVVISGELRIMDDGLLVSTLYILVLFESLKISTNYFLY